MNPSDSRLSAYWTVSIFNAALVVLYAGVDFAMNGEALLMEPNVVDLSPLAIFLLPSCEYRIGPYILVITFRSPLRRSGKNVRVTSWGAFTLMLNASLRLSLFGHD